MRIIKKNSCFTKERQEIACSLSNNNGRCGKTNFRNMNDVSKFRKTLSKLISNLIILLWLKQKVKQRATRYLNDKIHQKQSKLSLQAINLQ